jgi:hypothetical protein
MLSSLHVFCSSWQAGCPLLLLSVTPIAIIDGRGIYGTNFSKWGRGGQDSVCVQYVYVCRVLIHMLLKVTNDGDEIVKKNFF